MNFVCFTLLYICDTDSAIAEDFAVPAFVLSDIILHARLCIFVFFIQSKQWIGRLRSSLCHSQLIVGLWPLFDTDDGLLMPPTWQFMLQLLYPPDGGEWSSWTAAIDSTEPVCHFRWHLQCDEWFTDDGLEDFNAPNVWLQWYRAGLYVTILLTGSCQPSMSPSRLNCRRVIRLHVFDFRYCWQVTVSSWQSFVGVFAVSLLFCCFVWFCSETQIWLGDLRVALVALRFLMVVMNGFAIWAFWVLFTQIFTAYAIVRTEPSAFSATPEEKKSTCFIFQQDPPQPGSRIFFPSNAFMALVRSFHQVCTCRK